MVGPADEDGEESFDIVVCTPKWLEEICEMEDIVIGRHYFIVRKYNYEKIILTIEKFLQQCSGKNWDEVGRKVSRLGRWEFEDYIE